MFGFSCFEWNFSKTPSLRNAQKHGKGSRIFLKMRYVRTLFCELAQMYVVFPFSFFLSPLGRYITRIALKDRTEQAPSGTAAES
jgi:hypothetical protein